MIIEFAQTILTGVAATETIVRKSKKEYKEQEALRRSQMTVDERHKEDIGNLLARMI